MALLTSHFSRNSTGLLGHKTVCQKGLNQKRPKDCLLEEVLGRGGSVPSGIKVEERVPRLLFGVRVHTLIPVFLDFDTGTRPSLSRPRAQGGQQAASRERCRPRRRAEHKCNSRIWQSVRPRSFGQQLHPARMQHRQQARTRSADHLLALHPGRQFFQVPRHTYDVMRKRSRRSSMEQVRCVWL